MSTPGGAWSKGAPSEAVRAAPPKHAVVTPSPRQTSAGRGSGSGGRHRHSGRGGRGRNTTGGGGRSGGGRGGRHSSQQQQQQRGGGTPTNKSKTNLDKVKLCQAGDGTTIAEKQVTRHSAEELLQWRLEFLSAPSSSSSDEQLFHPPTAVLWKTDDERLDAIHVFHNARRKGGDVTPRPPKRPSVQKETAPPLEECEPIQINDETRWKAKHMTAAKDDKTAAAGGGDDGGATTANDDDSKKQQVEEESDEVILAKALSILNKLSLTTFDKLSQELVSVGIARNDRCLQGTIELIVDNAHLQPHFASMYALLCAQLSQWQVGGKRTFKKLLLHQCQVEFEKDTDKHVQERICDIQDAEEREYQASLIKRNYLGHMRFIGELYKNDMIKIEIMLSCLTTLLEDDEEQLECFAKLMTTSGGSLETQAMALRDVSGKPAPWEQLQELWKAVAGFTKKAPSNRIKFMLQDLMDLRANGWIERRQKETAKTVDQIRKEAAKEERQKSMSGGGGLPSKPAQLLGSRRASTGDVRIMDRRQQPIVDKDGFTQVTRTGSSSSLHVAGSSSLAMAAAGVKPKPSSGSLRRATSLPASKLAEAAPPVSPPPPSPPAAAPTKTFPSVDECSGKSQKILKEYFVGGDTDDAVLSIDEVVGVGHDGSIERGAKVIEGGTLLVMEMKAEEVNKFVQVLLRCLKENKIEKESIVMGMNDPLEFLSDIEIDAPLARTHLVAIVAALVKDKAIHLDFLLESPDYFRDEGKAASFAAKVLKAVDDEMLDAHVEVIEKLMTDDDKEANATARDLLASI